MFRLCPYAICILLFSGCYTGSWKLSRVVAAETTIDVQIERWEPREERAPTALYAHPVVVQPRVVQDFLGSLQYRKSGLFAGEQMRSVVDRSQIVGVAAAISRGLEESKADERVRFAVQVPGVALGMLPTTYTTRGVAFVKPAGVLNMAFDQIGDSAHADDEDDQRPWGDPTRPENTRVQLALPTYVTQYQSPDGTKHPLWVTAKLEDIQTPADAAITPPSASEPTPNELPLPESEIRTPLTDEEVLARLRLLEELHREGTISDEDYGEKRGELLFRDK